MDHAECEIDGKRVQLYVLDDAQAKEQWIRGVSGFPSEAEMEAAANIDIRGLWAVGSFEGFDVKALADRLQAQG